MDEVLLGIIKKSLIEYEKSIDNTDRHFNELKRRGRYSARTPFGFKHLLSFRIELLKKEGVSCEDFQKEYERITKKLNVLEKKREKSLREKLFSELKEEVKFYPIIINSFAELEPYELEIPNSLLTRTSIEIYLMELEKDYDLTEIKKEVYRLDEELRRKYMENIEEILETYFDADYPYSPESFWWDHPSKLLKEKQAMQNNS